MLEGELTFRIGPDLERVTAPAGTFVAVPPNVIHGFDNDSSERARFLNFHAPSGGFADYLRGVNPGFDSFEPPGRRRPPRAAAIVSLPGAGERLARATVATSSRPSCRTCGDRDVLRAWLRRRRSALARRLTSTPSSSSTATEFINGTGGPGTFVAAPPGAVHGFKIADDRHASSFSTCTPEGFVARLRGDHQAL